MFKDITDKEFEAVKNITEIIIEDKDVDEATKEMIFYIIDRYHFHMKNAYQAQMRYRFVGNFILILTPFLGATVSVIPLIEEIPVYLSVITGIIIAVVGPISSAYKFSYNFESSAKTLIDLHDWSVDFVISLQNILNDDHKTKLDDFLRQKDLRISEIGAKFSSIIVPSLSEESMKEYQIGTIPATSQPVKKPKNNLGAL